MLRDLQKVLIALLCGRKQGRWYTWEHYVPFKKPKKGTNNSYFVLFSSSMLIVIHHLQDDFILILGVVSL